LGFGFYFSKNPVFGWVLGFFKIKNKKLEIFRQNCDKRRKKSKKIIQFFKLIARAGARGSDSG
jgi:hypothetical protein